MLSATCFGHDLQHCCRFADAAPEPTKYWHSIKNNNTHTAKLSPPSLSKYKIPVAIDICISFQKYALGSHDCIKLAQKGTYRLLVLGNQERRTLNLGHQYHNSLEQQ